MRKAGQAVPAQVEQEAARGGEVPAGQEIHQDPREVQDFQVSPDSAVQEALRVRSDII